MKTAKLFVIGRTCYKYYRRGRSYTTHLATLKAVTGATSEPAYDARRRRETVPPLRFKNQSPLTFTSTLRGGAGRGPGGRKTNTLGHGFGGRHRGRRPRKEETSGSFLTVGESDLPQPDRPSTTCSSSSSQKSQGPNPLSVVILEEVN